MRRISCSFGFFAVLALMIYYGQDSLPLFCAAAVHELGHLAAMAAAGKRDVSVRLSAGGIIISRNDGCSASGLEEAFILLAGPMAGIISALAARGYYDKFFEAGMILSAINMLPLRATDGGSIFEMMTGGKRRRLDAAAIVSVMAAFLGAEVFCRRKGLNTAWAAVVSLLLLVRHLLSEE